MKAVEGWKKGRLGELCSIDIGGTPSRSNPDFWDSSKESSNRWVSIRDLNRSVLVDTNEYISDSGVKHSNVKLQNPGTVLLSFKLSIGRVAFAGVPLYTNEAIAGLNSEKIDLAFLFHGLHQWDLLQNVDQAIKGATLNKAKLKKIEFEYPSSKPEQAKIAEILSTVDRAIEQTEALIAKQQRIKTGLMQDLLTRGIDEHGNLRSEQTHKFKDSPLGRIPVEWEVKSLQSIADYQNGRSFPSGAYGISGVRLVRPGNLSPNGWVVWDEKHTTHLPISFWGKARDYQVGAGEILMNLTAQSLEDQFLGRVCLTPPGDSCLLNQRIARITPYSCDLHFLYWSLKGPHFRQYIDSIPQGTKVQHIYNRNLDAGRLAVPRSLPEQRSVADTLWGIENKTDATLKQLHKLHSLKSALMQALLTGRKRVIALLTETEVANM